jgi:hypothetical protein
MASAARMSRDGRRPTIPLPLWCSMLSRRIRTFALVALPMISAVGARELIAQSAPSQQQLDSISARGRALAGYQRAAWLASTQLLATNPDPWMVQRYVAYHADSGWVVAFGRVDSERDTFYVSHIGIPAAMNGQRVDSIFEFQTFGEPGLDSDFLVRAARAQDLAVMTFGVTSQPYSAAVIPNEKGEWLVYLVPSADAASAWPVGDDVRYRISADGRRVLETHRMHAGMVVADGTRLTAGKPRKTLHDLPEDSDVFHVLMSRPASPEIVATSRYRYAIGVDGSIKLLSGKETVVGATR